MELETLFERAAAACIPAELIRAHALQATRLEPSETPAAEHGSRLGGRPSLPPGSDWPRWDARDHDAAELASAQAMADKGIAYWIEKVPQLEARLAREPLPLTFLAQLDLADLAGLPHGLPLPTAGHLAFFYETDEQPWGYAPVHRGAWRVLFTPPGAQLELLAPPADLPDEAQLDPIALGARPTWTLPSWLPPLEDEAQQDALWDPWCDLAAELPSGHQVGGQPLQLQGDMRRCCALVTAGVYLGSQPPQPPEELDRLAADADSWRLLLQLTEVGPWSWGDEGVISWWLPEPAIASGDWDAAWFQLQTS